MTASAGREVVEHLFERMHRPLWRFALRMCGDVDRARDLVQDTFLKALRRRLPENEQAAEAWLYRTLLNRARDLHRRDNIRRTNPQAAQRAVAIGASPDPEAAALSRERLNRAMGRLAPRRKAILLLHELDGRGVEWISRTLGIRVSTVRWHLARAKAELRGATRIDEERLS